MSSAQKHADVLYPGGVRLVPSLCRALSFIVLSCVLHTVLGMNCFMLCTVYVCNCYVCACVRVCFLAVYNVFFLFVFASNC